MKNLPKVKYIELNNPDIIWNKLLTSDSSIEINALSERIACIIKDNLSKSKLNVILKYVIEMVGNNKDVRILDCGCGGGQLVMYLKFLGYKNVIGVDVYDQNRAGKLNLRHFNAESKTGDIFFKYDGSVLPFKKCSFDFIISQQVIEHVFDVENYFSECCRVLVDRGSMLLDFPQRLIPYDSHTRMWFVHYLPKKIRDYIYDKYRSNEVRKGSIYYNNFLFLKTTRYYKNILRKIFSKTHDCTIERISSFNYSGVYEGNRFMRYLAHWTMKIPLISVFTKKLFSLISISTLIVTK